ncbi:hypothetical protein [Sphingomonas sp. Root720]|uniref:hypothetical protein n=2 Tax=Sphingomonas TaxID=13687 RepID=UPI001F15A6EB|nr:hypothetical protein [Sphingomonas sp. Root720]
MIVGTPQSTDESFRDALVRVVGDLDSGFVCPQFLGSDTARQQEIEAFATALAEIGVSYDDALEIRTRLLARHRCIPKPGDDA